MTWDDDTKGWGGLACALALLAIIIIVLVSYFGNPDNELEIFAYFSCEKMLAYDRISEEQYRSIYEEKCQK